MLDARDVRQHYEEQGYAVVRGALNTSQIDDLLAIYRRDILHSRQRFFRQSTSRYETNRLSDAGFVIQSFLDIHAYSNERAFSAKSLDVFFSEEMRQALENVTGFAKFHVMQSMFFDANTATPAHQDYWYLDSVPNGNLVAAWIALEDIHEDAGRFYVVRGTRQIDFREGDTSMRHSDWLERIRHHVDARPEAVHAPALAKGDVLFWNSKLVHGSLPTRDAARSRKSLTCHYLPTQFTFGNLHTAKEWVELQDYKGHKFFRNQPDYSHWQYVKSMIKARVYDSPRLMRIAREIQKRSA